MPTRRMRCSVCCKAKDNYDALNTKADPNKRVCDDCKGQVAQEASPMVAAVPPPNKSESPNRGPVHFQGDEPEYEAFGQEEPEEVYPYEQEEEEEEEAGAHHAHPLATCPHTGESGGICPAGYGQGAGSEVAPSHELIHAFHQWLYQRNPKLCDQPDVVQMITAQTARFLHEPTNEAFAEAVMRGQHHRVVRRVANSMTISDSQIDTMYDEIKKGKLREKHGFEGSDEMKLSSSLKRSAKVSATAGPTATAGARPRSALLKSAAPRQTEPMDRLPPFNKDNYTMSAKHMHEDRYYSDTNKLDGTDFQPAFDATEVMVGQFTGGQSFTRIHIKNDEDYQEPIVQEPLHQGGADIVPKTWSGFRDAFSNFEIFADMFLHDGKEGPGSDTKLSWEPPSYPKGCTSDIDKIEYIMGFSDPQSKGKLSRAVKQWDTHVSCDALLVPPPPPGPMGNIRFQPAFAGMFLFYYDDPAATDHDNKKTQSPFMYIIIASSGTGTPLSLYTNKVTVVAHQQAKKGPDAEPPIRLVQTRTGGKFTPTSSSDNYYSHGMKVYPGTGKMFFLIDVYYGATPPVFFWEAKDVKKSKYTPHLRVEIGVEALEIKESPEHDHKKGSIFHQFWGDVKEVAQSMMTIVDHAVAPIQHIDSFVSATMQKGMQMQKFTAPYLPPTTTEAEVITLVFEPDGSGQDSFGLKLAADLLAMHTWTDKDLGISLHPHAISIAEWNANKNGAYPHLETKQLY